MRAESCPRVATALPASARGLLRTTRSDTQSRFDPARAPTKILTMNNERGENDDRPFLDRSTAHAVVSPGDPSFGRPTARAVRAWAVAAARLLGGVLAGAVRALSDLLPLVYHLAAMVLSAAIRVSV